MKRLLLISAAVFAAAACDTSTTFNAEGYKCDPGNFCPDGFACVDGICRGSSSAGGGSGGGVGGGVGGGDGGGVGGGAGGGGGADGGDLCSGVACNTPPANSCPDSNTLRTYPATGVCNPASGQCEYSATDSACPTGCSNGTCPNSLCVGVSCSSPPAAACDNASTLRTYSSSGTCEPTTGACSYASTTQACANGCSAGACLAPPYTFTQILPNVRARVNAVDQVPNSSGDHVLAVGAAGYVAKWNGTGWTKLSSPSTKDLLSVWLFLEAGGGVSGYVGGSGGALMKYDGTSLTAVNVPQLTANVTSIHGNDASSIIAGGGTQLAIKNATDWAVVNPTSAGIGSQFNSIKGVYAENGTLRAAGRCTTGVGVTTVGPCAVHFTSVAANPYIDIDTSTSAPATEYLAVGPDLDQATSTYSFLAGGKSVRRYNSSTGAFDTTNTFTTTLGNGIVALSRAATSGTGAVFALSQTGGGNFGALLREVNVSGSLQQTKLIDVFNTGAIGRNDSGGVIVADSGPKSANIGRVGPNTNEYFDLGEHWVSADISTGTTGYVLANAFGDVALPTAPGVFAIERNPTTSSTAIINDAAGGGPVIMVGEGGLILRYSVVSASISQLTSPTTRRLNAVCRVSDSQYYAVGDNGTIVSLAGAGIPTATLMTSGTTQNLYDVRCSATGAVAVGDMGTVVRLSGSAFTPTTPAFPSTANLRSATLVGGTLFVAGDSVFAKLESGAWTTTLPAKSGVRQLQARSVNEVYGITADTVVRFNGSSWSNVLTATSGLVGSVATSSRIVFVGSDGAVVEGQ